MTFLMRLRAVLGSSAVLTGRESHLELALLTSASSPQVVRLAQRRAACRPGPDITGRQSLRSRLVGMFTRFHTAFRGERLVTPPLCSALLLRRLEMNRYRSFSLCHRTTSAGSQRLL